MYTSLKKAAPYLQNADKFRNSDNTKLKVSTGELARVCGAKGINARVEFWGLDVNHDWDWWYKQVPYFVPHLLG